MAHAISSLFQGIIVTLATILAAAASYADSVPVTDLQTLQVRVRIASAQNAVTIKSSGQLLVKSYRGQKDLPAGSYTISVSNPVAPAQRHHLVIKTFQPTEAVQAEQFMAQWKAQGYSPEIVIFGRKFGAPGGAAIDNRSLWISLARPNRLSEAEALQKKLEAQKVYGWIVPETLPGAAGTLTISSNGAVVAQGPAPLTFQSSSPLAVPGVDRGFWKSSQSEVSFGGVLEVGVGPDGLMQVVESVPVEQYLAGVLPAEMPALWPTEALKAQAVAARTEIFAALGGKHQLEGFDFCATEHCRAYGGHGGRQPSTDQAVAATAGTAIVSAGKFVSTVFSANCGGCTENNDTVWSAPANGALRSIADTPSKAATLQKKGISAWIKSPPKAYCDHNRDYFRWTRRYTARELTDLVNKKYTVGTVSAVEPLERGPGGRLTAVKIIGSSRTEIVRKELNIRLAFGGLPSAMFIVEKGAGTFSFAGAGRGHGVGLCQDGARGMALDRKSYSEILNHYYSNVDIIRLQ